MKEERKGSKKGRSTILDHLIARQRVGSIGTVEIIIKIKREERDKDRLEAEKEFLENSEKIRKVIRSPIREEISKVETKSRIEIKKSIKKDKKMIEEDMNIIKE